MSGVSVSEVVILDGDEAAFQRRLAALNRKAKTYKLPLVEVLERRPVAFWVKYETLGREGERALKSLVEMSGAPGAASTRPAGSVVLMGERIKISAPVIKAGNWQLIAKLEAEGDANLQYAISRDPVDLAAISRLACNPLSCDHCKTNRGRLSAFVVKNEQGEYKEIGSSCLEDYTGIDPGAALFLADLHEVINLAGDLDGWERSGGRRTGLDVREFVAMTKFFADRFGFVSRARSNEEAGIFATADLVQMFGERGTDQKVWDAWEASRPGFMAYADRVIAWGKALDVSNDFDGFNRNLQVLLGQEVVKADRRRAGFLAAAVPSHDRTLRDAQRAAESPSVHVGASSEKLKSRLTIEGASAHESRYGCSTRVRMRDEAGNVLVWWASNPPEGLRSGDSPAGSVIDAAFTVKKHDEYKGVAQTEVTRLKVLGWVSRPPSIDEDFSAENEARESGESGLAFDSMSDDDAKQEGSDSPRTAPW